MKPTFRLKKRADLGKLALQGFLAACALWMAVSANARTGDEPYFDLYPGGDATTVDLCVTDDCVNDPYMTVEAIHSQPAGTGFRQSFLRLQEYPEETGYNTNPDGSGVLQDGSLPGNNYVNGAKDAAGHNWNHAVLVSDLENVGGYYEIMLDINEPSGNKDFIRLDEFEVHLSSGGVLSSYDAGTNAVGDGDFGGDAGWVGKVADMDYWHTDATGADDAGYGGMILKNCGTTGRPAGRCGSGDEDYLFRIPVALFEAAAGGSTEGMFMHVVASFGDTDQFEGFTNSAPSEAGFEEFAARVCEECEREEVPIPGTIFLLGIGVLGLYGRRLFAR
jgi:hypothetical protein